MAATTREKTLKVTTGKTTRKSHVAVPALFAAEPGLSIPEVALRIGKGSRATEQIVRLLRESGKLVRIGPDKGGHWQVIE